MNDIAHINLPLTPASEVLPGAVHHRRPLSGRGFTLIEALIVVVILGILMAVALPSLATQNDLSASAASRMVVADLLYAQSEAISTGQLEYVSFTLASGNPGSGKGAYSLSSPYGIAVTNPITHKPYTQTFGTGLVTALADVELAAVSLDTHSNTVLVFNELGQPLVCPPNGTPVALANTGTIELTCGAATVSLSIEPGTGNITVSP